jgi:probable phosphoglycerate mutase
MASKEVWLVRHGETTWNAEGRLCGWTDVPLTARGQEQARWLRPFLEKEPFDRVWSSDLRRAKETARLARGQAEPDERLREIHFGDLEGLPYESISEEQKRALIAFEGFHATRGESIEDFSTRVIAFLDELEPGRHLAFTHGGVCRAVMRQTGPDRFLPTGSLLGVDWTERKLLFVRENEIGTTSPMVRASGKSSGD